MDSRTKSITNVLLVALSASTLASLAKIAYGRHSGSLAFVADGVHSLFDSAATLMGILTTYLSSQPPDEGHPYGHQKFETISAVSLGLFLVLATYEVGKLALERLHSPVVPHFGALAYVLVFGIMGINLFVARYEKKRAQELQSSFLEADSVHNQADFLITLTVLITLVSSQLELRYVDGIASCLIALYLGYLSLKLVLSNLNPLVDTRVLDPKLVEQIAKSTDGVLYCHKVRSRGERGHHFLDLNIHLPGHISLDRAHQITHQVEDKLKAAFPGLVDVVIHTEPHNHPPCSKN